MRTERSLLVLVGSFVALSGLSIAQAQDVPPDEAAEPAPEASPSYESEPAPPPPQAYEAQPAAAYGAPASAPVEPMMPTGRTAMNSINAELLGPGLFYSLNYERMFIDDLGVRVGFSFIKLSASASAGGSTASASSTSITIPIIASYTGLRSDSGHGLDLGLGPVLAYYAGSASSSGISATATGFTAYGDLIIGYRLQPLDGGFQFRIGLDMLLGQFDVIDFNGAPGGFGMLPYGHMSFGGSF
jgi:hypothetical protein